LLQPGGGSALGFAQYEQSRDGHAITLSPASLQGPAKLSNAGVIGSGGAVPDWKQPLSLALD